MRALKEPGGSCMILNKNNPETKSSHECCIDYLLICSIISMVIFFKSDGIILQDFFGELSYVGEIIRGVDTVGDDHELIQECPSHVPEASNCTGRNVAKPVEGWAFTCYVEFFAPVGLYSIFVIHGRLEVVKVVVRVGWAIININILKFLFLWHFAQHYGLPYTAANVLLILG